MELGNTELNFLLLFLLVNPTCSSGIYKQPLTKTLYFPLDFNFIQLWWEANNLIWMRCNEGPILAVRLVARDSKKAFTCKLKTIFSADFIAFIYFPKHVSSFLRLIL